FRNGPVLLGPLLDGLQEVGAGLVPATALGFLHTSVLESGGVTAAVRHIRDQLATLFKIGDGLGIALKLELGLATIAVGWSLLVVDYQSLGVRGHGLGVVLQEMLVPGLLHERRSAPRNRNGRAANRRGSPVEPKLAQGVPHFGKVPQAAGALEVDRRQPAAAAAEGDVLEALLVRLQ